MALNVSSGNTPLVLLCPAWKIWGTATTVKPNTTIIHSRQDDVIPFSDSEELIANSGLPPEALIEVGSDHRLADSESLAAMLRAAIYASEPDWSDSEDELLQQAWSGLCYTAVLRWIRVASDIDWRVIHGTVLSGKVGKRIDHAWCENGGVIVDLAMPIGSRIIHRERYYLAIQPEISRTYSSDDALFLAIKNGHDGRWDESEQLRE